MSMWNWLSHLNPNIVLPVAGAIGGWLWHKISGSKDKNVEKWSKVVSAVFGNFAHELLDKYQTQDLKSYLDQSRKWLEDHAWQVLSKRGVPQNSLTKTLVHTAVEETTVWLAEQVRTRSGK